MIKMKSFFNDFAWVDSPGAEQSAHTLFPGRCTSSRRILLFLARLAIDEKLFGPFCGVDGSNPRKTTTRFQLHVDVSSSAAQQQLKTLFLVTDSVFPLIRAASYGLLFCSQTLRDRNKAERKWNRRNFDTWWLGYCSSEKGSKLL